MKVLQFIPSLRACDGGTTTYMQQVAPVLGRMCELHVAVMSPADENVALDGCQVHVLQSDMRHFHQMGRQWMALLRDISPDVVHINCCWQPQIALFTHLTSRWRASASSSAVKLILTPHGMLEPWIIARHYWTRKVPAIWLYQRRAVRQCDMLVATADEEREHLLQLGWNSRVALVKNGIDVAGIAPKTKWNEPRRLLSMSRIHPKKGLEILFDAMADVRRSDSAGKCNKFVLDVAGSGDAAYVAQLQQRVREQGLSDCVTFLGSVYGDEKWRLLRESDAVVLPSYSENYGLIVAEALSVATPVITTTGTPWQSIREAGCGWWVAPEKDALADALRDLQSRSATEMETMGRRARLLAENECEITSKMAELYDLYLSKL